jgi:hypothetical protein
VWKGALVGIIYCDFPTKDEVSVCACVCVHVSGTGPSTQGLS